MAKVTVTFTDKPENGENSVDVSVDFDPPVTATDPGTPAQHAAIDVIEWLQAHSEPEAPKADGEAG
jgi:hypothetical protein